MVIVAQLCEYTKSHWVAHFKRISYTDFNLNMKESSSKNKIKKPHNIKWKKQVTKEYILYNSIYMCFSISKSIDRE